MASFHLDSGEPEKGLEVLEPLLAPGAAAGQDHALYLSAWCFRRKEAGSASGGEAETAYRRLIAEHPGSPFAAEAMLELAQRLYEGDTADAVARRSTVPCLFVRRPLRVPARMIVAVDGTDRGMRVLQVAGDITTRLGCRLSGVIVERLHPGEPPALAGAVPTARTAALQRRLNGDVEPLLVRQGDPAPEILAAAHDLSADVIIIGYRRGGPPGLIEAGSVARYVAHHAPCAVLTVPL